MKNYLDTIINIGMLESDKLIQKSYWLNSEAGVEKIKIKWINEPS